MSLNHLLVTAGFSLLFIILILVINDASVIKSNAIKLLVFGEDKLDYYFMILNLKFNKEEWLFKRILLSTFSGILIGYVVFKDRLYLIPVLIFVVYKYFYFDLIFRYRSRIKTINNELPYFLKMVVNGCYYRPLLGSLISASEFVFDEFKEDVDFLINEIDENPVTYKPYQELIDKYNNKIRHLDTYLKSLYRLSQTANLNSTELLDTLSKMVSDDINIVRSERSKVFNSSLSYLGLLPVMILTIAICTTLMLSIKNII